VETGPSIHNATSVSTALQSEDLAFESLYRLHRPSVYAYALSTVRHPADAEDVTQTTFLNAYCALHRGVAPRDDQQWLLAIARNVCRDRFRDTKRHPKEEPLADWMRLVQPEEPDYSVTEICKEISELSPRYRQILLMREFEGRSYAEISSQLGVTEGAVQTLLGRARRALRDELELGMTCSQARRVSLRHLNGVALREERRALQRHVRRCAECATFVGRAPRTPVARMLWLVWLPYRRIMTVIAGTSAPAGSTAGGTAAIAAKLLTVAVVGGAAAGVTAREVADAPTVGHVKTQPATPIVTSHRSHASKQLASTAVTTRWGAQTVSRGRGALTPTSHHAHWLPQLSSGTRQPPEVAPPTPETHVGVGSPAEATPAGAPVATEPETAQPTTPAQEPAPSSTSAAVMDAAPASSATGSATSDSPASSSPDVTIATSASPGTTAPDTAPATSTTPETAVAPVTTPPAPAPMPPAVHGNNGNPNNGNGQSGTPPGQLNKPDPPTRGQP
jgi:RNA polymerase sigma factor (sigma-70 family)